MFKCYLNPSTSFVRGLHVNDILKIFRNKGGSQFKEKKS